MQIQNNLINTALQGGIEKFIFLGSSCIYPNGSSTAKRRVFTTGPLEPTNEWYAIAKISGLKPEAIRKQFNQGLRESNANKPIWYP
jgi:GDP-L-fucose synthase